MENPITITNLDCSCLNFNANDARLQRYIAIRKKSFELMIIEIAYFNWSAQNGKLTLTQANYEDNLTKFLDIINSHIFSVIERENSAQAAELGDAKKLSIKILEYSKYLRMQELFLSEKTLIHISKIEGTIEVFFQENQDAYFLEEVNYVEFKSAFKALYVVMSMGQIVDQPLDDLLEINKKLEGRINVSLDTIAYDFKEYQRMNERNTRADQKIGEKVKESIPTIGISDSIVKKLKMQLNGK